ncbi:MAG: hypothetical protein Q7R49_03610 [Candidatus Daviesbacteria bacterium]|nr:hypothetical protein [Candidatus Daviesbacteria bacterium]
MSDGNSEQEQKPKFTPLEHTVPRIIPLDPNPESPIVKDYVELSPEERKQLGEIPATESDKNSQ